MRFSARPGWILSLVAAVLATGLAWQAAAAIAVQHYVAEGIAMDVEIEPLGNTPTGQDVGVSVRLSDATSGTPLAAANPAGWLSLNRRGTPPTEQVCRREIAAFLGGSPFVRPDVDLTGFTLVAMNRDPSVTVLDPQGGFGGSRMLAMLPLESPGMDWAVGLKPPRLYVTEPEAKRLAVIDTERWQRTASIAMPDSPAAALLQHDGRYLWVAAQRDGAVTTLAPDTLAVAARIPLGAGTHLLAITSDDGRLFVTNQDDGSVSVIDPRVLAVVATIPVGTAPRAIATSALANLVYVAVADSIAVLDPVHNTLTGRIDGIAGAAALAISPDGRWGFVASPARSQVFIFDTTTNRLVQTMTIENAPFEIAFTSTEAYIRRRDSEAVTLVPLAPLRADGKPAGRGEFPAGEKPVAATIGDTLAASMVASPGEPAMLLASPAEHAIHYYHEGMAAPADSFDDLGRQPVAVAVVDRSLRQTARGTYTTIARLPAAGVYDLALLLDSPRVAHCFELDSVADLGAKRAATTLEPVLLPRTVETGSPVVLAFRPVRQASQRAAATPATATALVILSPGSWFVRVPMVEADDGTWRLRFIPPHAGIYMVAFDVPDLALDINSGPHFTIEATEPGAQEPRHE
ncbi:MAG: YncE family protein [Acetobacteraceae bacterium]|jgi:YVTN family beta-propeller protein